MAKPKQLKELLERRLNRKLVQHRLFTHPLVYEPISNPLIEIEDFEFYQIFKWLPKFWIRINDLLLFLNINNFYLFGIQSILTCPLIHIQMSLNWFIDLWNNLLVPLLFKHQTSNELTKFNHMLQNLINWILSSWPWNLKIMISKECPKILIESKSLTKSNMQNSNEKINYSVQTQPNRTSLDSGILIDGLNAIMN